MLAIVITAAGAVVVVFLAGSRWVGGHSPGRPSLPRVNLNQGHFPLWSPRMSTDGPYAPARHPK